MIQFSHNDGGKPGTGKDRGSLDGLREESVEITKASRQQEVVHTYGWNLRKYIADARAKGPTPIVLSLTVGNEWEDGKIERGPRLYSKWSEEIARSEKTACVDLNNIVRAVYKNMDQENVRGFFPKDHTHTSAEAADLNAHCEVAGLKANAGQPFARDLSVAAQAIEPKRAQSAERSPFPTLGQLSSHHDKDLPTVFFIGDSTVKNGRDDGVDGLWGWAHPIASRFDRARINVENQTLGGMSSRTHRTAGHWDNVLKLVEKADYVVMVWHRCSTGKRRARSLNRWSLQSKART